jgi:hypothetical protein
MVAAPGICDPAHAARRGDPTDTYLDEEDLDNELTYWAGGRFLWLGREYPLAWFRTHESAALRHTLGLDEQ